MFNIKLKYGNLIKARSDFIVNASNTELILGSGVSKAFRQHCGGSAFQQNLYKIKEQHIQHHGPIKQGDVIVSDSGFATNFDYALHVAVMNYTDDTKPPFPTYKQLKHAFTAILSVVQEIAEQENIVRPTVTIPLLGTGTGGLNKTRVYALTKRVFSQAEFDGELIVYFHSKKDFLRFYFAEKKKWLR